MICKDLNPCKEWGMETCNGNGNGDGDRGQNSKQGWGRASLPTRLQNKESRYILPGK